MTKSKKQTRSAKSAPTKPLTAQAGAFHQTVHGIFGKIQAKTGLNDTKLDQFQKAWLAMPQTRTKYQHLKDAPMVALEEGLAMVNDILDFLQNQKGGESLVFEKLKNEVHELASHPVDYLHARFKQAEEAGKKLSQKAKEFLANQGGTPKKKPTK